MKSRPYRAKERMKPSSVSLTNKSTLLNTDQTIHFVFLVSFFCFFAVKENSTQMEGFFFGAEVGFLTRKSGRAEGVYSIFVFEWATLQSQSSH